MENKTVKGMVVVLDDNGMVEQMHTADLGGGEEVEQYQLMAEASELNSAVELFEQFTNALCDQSHHDAEFIEFGMQLINVCMVQIATKQSITPYWILFKQSGQGFCYYVEKDVWHQQMLMFSMNKGPYNLNYLKWGCVKQLPHDSLTPLEDEPGTECGERSGDHEIDYMEPLLRQHIEAERERNSKWMNALQNREAGSINAADGENEKFYLAQANDLMFTWMLENWAFIWDRIKER